MVPHLIPSLLDLSDASNTAILQNFCDIADRLCISDAGILSKSESNFIPFGRRWPVFLHWLSKSFELLLQTIFPPLYFYLFPGVESCLNSGFFTERDGLNFEGHPLKRSLAAKPHVPYILPSFGRSYVIDFDSPLICSSFIRLGLTDALESAHSLSFVRLLCDISKCPFP
jgi:hypothetical protein